MTDEAADIGLLQAAVALAVRDGAHLEVSCLDVDATRLDMLPLGAAPMVVDFDRNHGPARGRADELAAWVRKELDALAVPVHASVEAVVIADPGLDAGIARLLRYADLVIAGLPYGALRNSLRAAVIEAALFGTDAPVLVLPDRPVDLSRPFGRIMLGWNDTDVALSAARKALPFLQEAGHVDIVMVDPPSHSPATTPRLVLRAGRLGYSGQHADLGGAAGDRRAVPDRAADHAPGAGATSCGSWRATAIRRLGGWAIGGGGAVAGATSCGRRRATAIRRLGDGRCRRSFAGAAMRWRPATSPANSGNRRTSGPTGRSACGCQNRGRRGRSCARPPARPRVQTGMRRVMRHKRAIDATPKRPPGGRRVGGNSCQGQRSAGWDVSQANDLAIGRNKCQTFDITCLPQRLRPHTPRGKRAFGGADFGAHDKEGNMHLRSSLARLMAGAVALAIVAATPLAAETVVRVPGESTSGAYVDYMKTVYARAGFPETTQLPLTSFDNEYELHGLGAESWAQSEDGLTWTFTLREGLLFSDGEPLTAEDYVFALQRAASTGYDFGWYWDFAGGIAGWKEVTEGADASTLGVRAVDDLTIEVTTLTPKPYLPSVVSLWYPVPVHMWEQFGDEYAANVETLVASGPYMVDVWEKANNRMELVRNPNYTGPWAGTVDRIIADPTLGAPEVGLPAYMAGELDYVPLNAGQIPFIEQRMPETVRTNAIFATSYIAFDMTSPPFDNVDVRRALYYAIDREELTSTVLRGLAVPAGSIIPPSFPGDNPAITAQAVFDPARAQEYMATAGYPGGEGFPEVEIWYRDQGGYNGAITAPMLQYLQAEFAEHLGITMNIRVMPIQDWMNAMLNKENNLFLAPYEYDYIDPSNFYGIFYDGGRHDHRVPEYDALVAAADSNPVWEERLALYAQAEQVMIDNATIVPLVHPVQMFSVSDRISGPGVTPNSAGMSPLARINPWFWANITVPE